MCGCILCDSLSLYGTAAIGIKGYGIRALSLLLENKTIGTCKCSFYGIGKRQCRFRRAISSRVSDNKLNCAGEILVVNRSYVIFGGNITIHRGNSYCLISSIHYHCVCVALAIGSCPSTCNIIHRCDKTGEIFLISGDLGGCAYRGCCLNGGVPLAVELKAIGCRNFGRNLICEITKRSIISHHYGLNCGNTVLTVECNSKHLGSPLGNQGDIGSDGSVCQIKYFTVEVPSLDLVSGPALGRSSYGATAGYGLSCRINFTLVVAPIKGYSKGLIKCYCGAHYTCLCSKAAFIIGKSEY